MIKVGLVGAGGIARVHAPIIQGRSDAELVAVVDANPQRARAFAAEFGIDAWYDDLHAMLEAQRPDVVHVVVPPRHHCAVVSAALEHGCHVLVEKPLALSRAEGEQMYETARRNDVLLCANHNFVFEALVQDALARVRDGAVGEVVAVDARFVYDAGRNPAVAEEGAEYVHWAFGLNGGLLQDLLPHPASLLAELLGEIDEVRVLEQSRGRLAEGFGDEIRIGVRSGRAQGSIEISLGQRPDIVALSIRGTAGTLDVDLYANALTLRGDSALPRAAARGLSALSLAGQYSRAFLRNVWGVVRGRMDKSGGIGGVVDGFYRAVRGEGPLPISPERALRVVELIDRTWPEPSAGTRRIAEAPAPRGPEGPPTVLVTGASGFIGTHLLESLVRDGESVRAMVRPGSIHAGRLRHMQVEAFEGDLSDEEALERAMDGIRVVYHLGGAVGNDWEEHRVATIAATDKLLQLAEANGAERFVYVSSLAICDTMSAPDDAIVTEAAPPAAELGPYARAKLEAERLVLAANDRGLPATILRPGIVIGPRGRVLFPHIAYSLRDRVFVMLGKGEAPLPLTYVENTVDALRRAATAPEAPGQVYHVVDDARVTASEYLDQLIRVAGLQSRVYKIPFAMAWLAASGYELAAAARLLPSGITSREQLQQKRKSVRFDCSRAKSQLGWEPAVAMEEGLRRTFEWYGSRSG